MICVCSPAWPVLGRLKITSTLMPLSARSLAALRVPASAMVQNSASLLLTNRTLMRSPSATLAAALALAMSAFNFARNSSTLSFVMTRCGTCTTPSTASFGSDALASRASAAISWTDW